MIGICNLKKKNRNAEVSLCKIYLTESGKNKLFYLAIEAPRRNISFSVLFHLSATRRWVVSIMHGHLSLLISKRSRVPIFTAGWLRHLQPDLELLTFAWELYAGAQKRKKGLTINTQDGKRLCISLNCFVWSSGLVSGSFMPLQGKWWEVYRHPSHKRSQSVTLWRKDEDTESWWTG